MRRAPRGAWTDEEEACGYDVESEGVRGGGKLEADEVESELLEVVQGGQLGGNAAECAERW